MKKITVLALCASSLMLPLAPDALGQDRRPSGPAEGGPRFGDGPRFERGPGRRGEGGRRGRNAKGGLNRVWRGISRLEKSGPALSKDQSKRVVALVLPWSKKPTMSQDEAKSLEQKLEAVLTGAQKTALDDGPRGFGGRPGPPPGRPPFGDGPFGGDGPPRGVPRGDGPRGRRARPDGPPDGGMGRGGRGRAGRGGGMAGMELSDSQRQIVRAWMETSNPFYAPTGTSGWKTLPAAFQKNAARRYQQNRATLEELSRRSR